eukprot:TRINITY_DN9903_c0_g1_i1.p1 TRINITY_DN9903_c0_g1~~TRINITY_DN9903_c0_g1_i1.p1  ORF type:complete len:243 (-),score=28.22 TRINITY_DN9903_c0_g1_i1:37-765(-)
MSSSQKSRTQTRTYAPTRKKNPPRKPPSHRNSNSGTTSMPYRNKSYRNGSNNKRRSSSKDRISSRRGISKDRDPYRSSYSKRDRTINRSSSNEKDKSRERDREREKVREREREKERENERKRAAKRTKLTNEFERRIADEPFGDKLMANPAASKFMRQFLLSRPNEQSETGEYRTMYEKINILLNQNKRENRVRGPTTGKTVERKLRNPRQVIPEKDKVLRARRTTKPVNIPEETLAKFIKQ